MSAMRIDRAAILEIQEMLEDEFVELVNTYKKDIDNKIAALGLAIDATDDDTIRKLSHSMKGASLNLGVIHFGELCHGLEEDAKVAIRSQYANHLAKIQEEKPMVFAELDALLV
jgi:HPt (histidine-containing phosphotransfer) domain-containing protein